MNEKINQWLAFIDMERGDLLDMAKKNNKVIQEAYEEYEVLTGDDEMKRLAEVRLMSYLEEQSALATARHRGTEEGLKQGRKEGIKKGRKEGIEKGIKQGLEQGVKDGQRKNQIETAIKLLKLKMPIEQIIEITNLNKEEILKLKL